MRRISKEAVEEKLRGLPSRPGCYIYKDEKEQVLYVGKALNLRSRVRSYFQSSAKHGVRIARLVSKVRDIEWVVTDNELEALILECNLIKKHRPPYNVRLRDDKSYPYIVITKETFPRVMFTRRVRRDGAKYYGPYTSAGAVRDTLSLLHNVFRLIPCGKSWTGEKVQRPCLYYHLNQCMAPCAGLADPKEYVKEIADVRLFLDGRQDRLIRDLKNRMNNAVERLDFEAAASLRDAIQSIESVLERQKVVAANNKDQDVIAVVKDGRVAAAQMFYVRGGKLIGQRQFTLDGANEVDPSEAVLEFVKRYYTDAAEVPREVLLPVEIEEKKIIESWLRQRRGAAVSIEVPHGGEKLDLIEMAANNAELALVSMAKETVAQEEWSAEAAAELQETLGLPAPPERIECFDISNIQGTAPVGSMVVFEGGQPAKAEYRRFKIKFNPEAPDDFAMMREAVLRRLRNFKDGKENFAKAPDLLVIDGGRGQLGAALRAMSELNLFFPVIGLAKKRELIYLPSAGANLTAAPQGNESSWTLPEPIELPLNSPGLVLLRRIRDEAHRFAVSFHRKVRDKRMFGSPLEEVPGIGPRRRRLLLRAFGSLEGIRRASVEAVASVPTMTEALARSLKSILDEET